MRLIYIFLACLSLSPLACFGQCPPSSCQAGCDVGGWAAVPRLPLVPVVRRSCVVAVYVGTDPNPSAGVYVGTIRGQGIVLTCLHVVRNGVRAVAGCQPIDIHKDRYGYDMAALIVAPLDVPAATLGMPPRPGGTVEIVGYPLGRFGRRQGRVIGYVTPEGDEPWRGLVIDTASQEGDSGGAVMDANGSLVGMIWGTHAEGDQESFAVPIEAIADFLRRLEIVLSGEVEPVVPPVPIPTPAPTTDCDDLRILILKNAEAIAALAAVARVPGPPGKPGQPGPPGPPGESGQPGSINYELLAAEVIKRLPPVRLQTVKLDGSVIQESSAPLGQPIKLRLVPVSSSRGK